MIKLRNICRTLCVICALTAVGCVDENYRIDEVSTEVTVAEGTTTLPIGYLNKKLLGDLLQEVTIEGLNKNSEGEYEFSLTGSGDEIGVEGISTEIEIPQISTQFTTEFPKFGITELAKDLDMSFTLSAKLEDDHLFKGQTVTVPAGYTVSAYEEESVTENLAYSVPKELSAIKRIYLKPAADGDLGARIDTRFLLNDLNAINGGGHLSLELRAPDGFKIYDSEGRAVEDGDFAISEFDFAAGEGVLDFVAYVESVECDGLVENGEFAMAVDLEYHVSFEMTTKAGTITYNKGPEIQVDADLAYHDADIVLNEIMLIDHEASSGGGISINELPKEVISIQELVFEPSSPIVLFASGFDWMDEALARSIILDAWLPEYIILSDNSVVGYNAEEHKLHTSLSALRNGIEVNLDALNFGQEGLKNENGSLEISFAPDIVAYIEQDTEIKLSSLQYEGMITLHAGIQAAKLDIASVSGWFDYTYDYTTEVNLSGVEDLGLEIKSVGLSPVLELSVCNPFSVDIVADLSVVPKFGGEADMSRALELTDVTIEGNEIVGGQITPTVIVLGTEDRRAEYEDGEATFVACDLEKVLRGRLPDSIDIALSIATDTESLSTLYAMDKYEFTYDYNFVLPVELSNELQVRYEDEFYFDEFGGNPLATIAGLDYIMVEDVALIAEVITTLPLQLAASADLLDAEGNVLDVKLALAEGSDAIVGSADGVTEACSTLRLELDLPGNGNIRQLADVAGIRFVLDAGGVDAQRAALRDEQYAAVNLQLELSGGITIDLEGWANATE